MTIGNGRQFNDQVESTAFAGRVGDNLRTLAIKVDRIESATDRIEANLNRIMGVIALFGVVGPIMVTLILRVVWP